MNEIKYPQRFRVLQLAVARQALMFSLDLFNLKSGRKSPYFFNASKLQDGEALAAIGSAYACSIQAEIKKGLIFDMLYGPAYKGIPLATAAAMGLNQASSRLCCPVVFNRKEAKDHGELGTLMGASMAKNRVLIIDDVLTAGTAVEEAVQIITSNGGTPAGVAIMFDRQERGIETAKSAVQEIRERHGFRVFSILNFQDLLDHAGTIGVSSKILQAMEEYRTEYGVGD